MHRISAFPVSSSDTANPHNLFQNFRSSDSTQRFSKYNNRRRSRFCFCFCFCFSFCHSRREPASPVAFALAFLSVIPAGNLLLLSLLPLLFFLSFPKGTCFSFCSPNSHGSVQFVTNWKLTLSYDGTGFHGWQVQPALTTVQGTLAQAIHRVTGATVLPQGSGRTDAGVHALAQVASFALEAAIPPPNFLRALNAVLPPSIRVLSAEHAPPNFHARHSALRKTYEYRIFERQQIRVPHSSRGTWRDEWEPQTPDRICPPFLAPFVWDCPWPLDFDRIQDAAARLIGQHNFASFAASDPDRTIREVPCVAPDTVRTLFASEWSRGDSTLTYRIVGSGFLHHMVRNLVGTFVQAGAGRSSADRIPTILAARSRSAAGPTAPARGLFLVNVEY